MEDKSTERLHSRGYRTTPQRLAILHIINQSGRHLAPLEIYQQALRVIPGITEATVYRTLSFLAQQGLILVAHVGSGQLVYETAEPAHHHLICRKCGDTRQIEHDLLKGLYQDFKETTGYQIDTVHATFFGLCPACQENDPSQQDGETNFG
jgi:Fe2+ or Zn2+ uptake regulation protein